MDLCRFPQLFPWNPTLFGSVCLHEANIHRQMFPLHQSHFHTLPDDLFEQFLEQLRFLKPSMSVFRNSSRIPEPPLEEAVSLTTARWIRWANLTLRIRP